MPTLQQGSIVWAVVRDPNGYEKKRPVVILTPSDEIDDVATLVGAAITTAPQVPLPDNYVPLPWDRAGHPRTGLKVRCWAVSNWLVSIKPTDIEDIAGIVPTRPLREILTKLLSPPRPPKS